jgi:hypothetical protein
LCFFFILTIFIELKRKEEKKTREKEYLNKHENLISLLLLYTYNYWTFKNMNGICGACSDKRNHLNLKRSNKNNLEKIFKKKICLVYKYSFLFLARHNSYLLIFQQIQTKLIIAVTVFCVCVCVCAFNLIVTFLSFFLSYCCIDLSSMVWMSARTVRSKRTVTYSVKHPMCELLLFLFMVCLKCNYFGGWK